MNSLKFRTDRTATVSVVPTALVIAGWTGRDAAAVEHHIEELAALGVARPSRVPLYYRVSHGQLTQSERIEVLGPASSGEAEPVMVRANGRWWLTVGSDHTDRQVESYSVAVSKQMCPKPIARETWAWSECEPHADEIELHSEILEGGRWNAYQRGTLASIRPLSGLVAGFVGDRAPAEGLVMFCGTLAAIPDAAGTGVRPATAMRLVLHDPRLRRTLSHEYRVDALPVVA
jgi:hypothetical protein